MKFKLRTAAVVVSISLSSLVLVFGGCTKYASQDDLNALERQRQAALSAEQKVQDLEAEKADLERQITQKEQELLDAEDLLKSIRGGENK